MNFTSSNIEKYGISVKQATEQGFILKGSRWSYKKHDSVSDGWRSSITGEHYYPTASKAIEGYFNQKAKNDNLKQEKAKAYSVRPENMPEDILKIELEKGKRAALFFLEQDIWNREESNELLDHIFYYLKTYKRK